MPPKKDSTSLDGLPVEDLIAAFRDDRVLEAIGTVFENKLQNLIAAVSSLTVDLTKAKEDIDVLKRENDQLQMYIQSIDSVIQANTTLIDQLDSYTKLDNLIIKGLPDSYATVATNDDDNDSASTIPRDHRDTTLAQVINLCQNHLKVDINAGDISTVYRLPIKRADTIKPVIVRFSNRRSRDLVYSARMALRNSRPTANPV